MSPLFLAIACGGGSGLIAGAVAGWVVAHQLTRPEVSGRPEFTIDSETDSRIDEAAQGWATAHDVPHAAGLVARKMRLALRLQESRRGGRPA
jgi:hypothetical protein